MKGTEQFKLTIKAYLDERAKTDELAIRPHKDKQESWVVDLCNNYHRFGRVEDLKLTEPQKGLYQIESNGRALTNVYF